MQKLNYAEMKAMLRAERARLENLIETGSAKDACNHRKTLTACVNMDALVTACGERFTANGELYTAKRETPIFNYGALRNRLYNSCTRAGIPKKARKRVLTIPSSARPLNTRLVCPPQAKTPHTPRTKKAFSPMSCWSTLWGFGISPLRTRAG